MGTHYYSHTTNFYSSGMGMNIVMVMVTNRHRGLSFGVRIGAGVIIENGVVIGANSIIKAGTIIQSGSVINLKLIIEANAVIGPGVVINTSASIPAGIIHISFLLNYMRHLLVFDNFH